MLYLLDPPRSLPNGPRRGSKASRRFQTESRGPPIASTRAPPVPPDRLWCRVQRQRTAPHARARKHGDCGKNRSDDGQSSLNERRGGDCATGVRKMLIVRGRGHFFYCLGGLGAAVTRTGSITARRGITMVQSTGPQPYALLLMRGSAFLLTRLSLAACMPSGPSPVCDP